MRLNESTAIISVQLRDVKGKYECVLGEKKGSRCHFAKKIVWKDYRIQLRLDWGAIENGEPALDADIWSITTGRKLRNGRWHHTRKRFDPKVKVYIYNFKFENLDMRLIAKTTVSRDLKCRVNIVRPGQDPTSTAP